MKKSFILICFFCLSINVFSQTTSGSLTVDETWTTSMSPIHITGDVTVPNNRTLTIDPGVVIKFDPATSLLVTGSGTLLANGTSGSKITFTEYSVTNQKWGHLYFNNTTASGNSKLEYCIIEKGKATGLATPFGGGILVQSSNLTITNCIIQGNQADWGGGIFLYQGYTLNIDNTLIDGNSCASGGGGGGIYFWNGTTSTITNCIIINNTAGGEVANQYGGGGVMIGHQVSNVRIINSVIANNTCSVIGDNVLFYYNTSSNTSITNSIIWGTANSVAYYSQTANANDLVNCAIEGTVSSSYTNCIDLNASNNDVNGPNFTTEGSDWSIKFISPCRDAGTTPSPAVSEDFIGKSRIGAYDIGAYEVQYSRWTGATSDSWSTSSNWDKSVSPSVGTGDVIVPAGLSTYPVNSSNPDFTVGSGKQMIIEQGARVTLEDLTNNGILKLNHAQNTTGFASLILKSYTRGTGGSEEIQLFLEGGGSEELEDYKWHYISSPVSSLSTNTFTGATLDLAQFVESRPSSSLLDGWVAYDGYAYTSPLIPGPTFNNLSPGKGYNFWDGTNNSFTIGGLLNTSDVAMSITYSAPMVSLRGFNLLGNPFSSGLNWDSIANGADYPANTSKGAYFTRDNVQCTYIGGIGTPEDVTGIIPPMQGFFTKTYSTGNTITLAAAARTHSGIHPRYKSGIIIPLVRLKLQKDNLYKDETVVRFDTDAQSGLDYDFDAEKMLLSTTGIQIYSASGGTKYAINGQPFPASVLEIPIIVNITKDTIHTISATQLQGLDGYGVFLRDYSTGINTDLKSTPVVSFSAVPGTISGRFALSFTTTGLEKPANLSDRPFNIYPANGLINIQTLNGSWDGKNGSVRILDITGKTITDINNAEFSTNSVFQVKSPVTKGIYIVELKAGPVRYVTKVVVK